MDYGMAADQYVSETGDPSGISCFCYNEYDKYGSCSVMEQFADIRVDRVNIQMEAEDADRTEI